MLWGAPSAYAQLILGDLRKGIVAEYEDRYALRRARADPFSWGFGRGLRPRARVTNIPLALSTQLLGLKSGWAAPEERPRAERDTIGAKPATPALYVIISFFQLPCCVRTATATSAHTRPCTQNMCEKSTEFASFGAHFPAQVKLRTSSPIFS